MAKNHGPKRKRQAKKLQSPTVLDWENGEIIEKNKNLKKLKKVLAFLKTLIYNIICVEEHMINN